MADTSKVRRCALYFNKLGGSIPHLIDTVSINLGSSWGFTLLLSVALRTRYPALRWDLADRRPRAERRVWDVLDSVDTREGNLVTVLCRLALPPRIHGLARREAPGEIHSTISRAGFQPEHGLRDIPALRADAGLPGDTSSTTCAAADAAFCPEGSHDALTVPGHFLGALRR